MSFWRCPFGVYVPFTDSQSLSLNPRQEAMTSSLCGQADRVLVTVYPGDLMRIAPR